MLDRKLEAYAANGAKTTLALRDVQDDNAAAHDLVFVSLAGLWVAYEDVLFSNLETIDDVKRLHVAVILSSGVGATLETMQDAIDKARAKL